MALQMILCMEANRKAATDYIYISDTIKRFYTLSNRIKISPLYMNGKNNYKSKSVLKTIDKLRKDFTSGDTEVIYCIDTDEFETNVDHARELKEISRFCEQNGYGMIWFCRDVEDVYLGKRMPRNEKVRAAAAFRRRNGIEDISPAGLSSGKKKAHLSNILIVLDQYLERK